MASLSFEINLAGNFANALERSGKALGDTEQKARGAKKEFELFEGEVGKLEGSLGGLGFNLSAIGKGGSLFTFDLAEGLKMAVEAVTKLIEGVADLGKEMVHAAADAQDLNLAIKLNVGDEQAGKIDELAESFQATTRFSAKQIKESLLPLLAQGMGGDVKQLDDLTTAATDYAARTKTGVAGVQQALETFGNIALRGQVNFRMLKSLRISEKAFNEDLAGLLHTDVKGAKRLMAAGKVDKETLLSVALHQLAGQQGGALGGPSLASAKTLGATLDRLGQLKDTLFERIAASPGMQAIQGFLDNFYQTLAGPIGTELVKKLSDAFTTLFGDMSGPAGLQKMQDAAKAVADQIIGLLDDFKDAWPDIKIGAEGVWDVIKGIAGTVADIVKGWREISNFIHEWDSGRIAKDISDTITGEHGGIATGNTPKNKIFDEASQTWRTNTGGATGSWGDAASSPGVPHLAAGGIVSGPTLALIGESGPEAVVPLSKASSTIGAVAAGGAAGRGAVSIAVGDLHYHGTSTGSAQEAHEFAQQFRVELKKVLDEAGFTVGAYII
jgi:hypothetical protein